MSIETVRTVFTYVIALVIIIGGGILLVVPTRIPANELLTFEQVVVGVVLGWVFSDRSASASSSRTLQALYTPAPPQLGGDVPEVAPHVP